MCRENSDTLSVTRTHLQPLLRREARIRVLSKLDSALVELTDLIGHVDAVVLCHLAHLQISTGHLACSSSGAHALWNRVG